jgi:FKBP-type peptidyl-prolyl cis-trans isomerase
MRVWVALAVVAGLASGCVGLQERACDEAAPTLRTPWVDGGYLRTDPGLTWDTVVLHSGAGADPVASAGPEGWTVEVERISPAEAANFSVLRVGPGHGKGHLGLDYAHEHCGESMTGTITWDLAAPEEGRAAEPGQGVHVQTAGFLEDGTLFYTNILAIDHDDWPRTDWYVWEGDEPIPVYVYDQDREEQPLYWHDPQWGTPVEGTVPGLGYVTTIPGFNDALKGLSPNTVRVVRLDPEEAYTHAGAEDSPLYGQAIVFYIRILDVVPLPCPMQAAWACGRAPVMADGDA